MNNWAAHELILPNHTSLIQHYSASTKSTCLWHYISAENDDVSFLSWYSNTNIHNSEIHGKEKTRQCCHYSVSQEILCNWLENRWIYLPFKLQDNTCHLHDYEKYVITNASLHKQNVFPLDLRQQHIRLDHKGKLWTTFPSTKKHYKKNNRHKRAGNILLFVYHASLIFAL